MSKNSRNNLFKLRVRKQLASNLHAKREASFFKQLSCRSEHFPQNIYLEEDKASFSYDHIAGRPLYTYYEKDNEWQVKQKLVVMRNLLTQLEIVHSMGLIHNDLSPGNIIVDADLNTHLIDFGHTTKNDEDTKTEGKPHYQSPEQAQKSVTTENSDLFQLGCVFFELLLREQYLNSNGEPQTDLNRFRQTPWHSMLRRLLREKDSAPISIRDCILTVDKFMSGT